MRASLCDYIIWFCFVSFCLFKICAYRNNNHVGTAALTAVHSVYYYRVRQGGGRTGRAGGKNEKERKNETVPLRRRRVVRVIFWQTFRYEINRWTNGRGRHAIALVQRCSGRPLLQKLFCFLSFSFSTVKCSPPSIAAAAGLVEWLLRFYLHFGLLFPEKLFPPGFSRFFLVKRKRFWANNVHAVLNVERICFFFFIIVFSAAFRPLRLEEIELCF